MTLPDKIHKETEGDYKYYDEEGKQISESTYQHWYGSVSYTLIWEGKYDCRELPVVYKRDGDTLEYNRLQDKELIEAIAGDYWLKVSQPLQTDGPVWSYERDNSIASMLGLMNVTIKDAREELNKKDKIQFRARDKFCRNCGATLRETGKFCEKCGAPIISV